MSTTMAIQLPPESSTVVSTSIFHRSLEKSYPSAVQGEGIYLVTEEGNRILDGSSGAAVSCIGHGNKEVVEAIIAQAQSLCFAHTSFFTSNPAEELARTLIDSSDGAFSKAMFLSSGSEAVESTLKLARQYHIYEGNERRVNIIGRMHSYHGNTLGALAAGNNPSRRKPFTPLLAPCFHHVSRCFYAADGSGLDEKQYEDKLIAEFEAKFYELGPDTVAAVIVEPVGGATLGTVLPTKDYLFRLKELCHRYGTLLIFDEVMCGMGRLGTYHAWQSLGGVAPDLQTIGKGLGAGYQPISAILMNEKVCSTFKENSKGSQAFISGHTYQGHAIGCVAALAVNKIVHRDGLLNNVLKMGELLEDTLSKELPPEFTAHGGSLRGMGLFRTVDFGKLGTSYGGPLAAQVAGETFRQGAAVYTCSPAVDAVMFAPPFIIQDADVLKLVRIFVQALESVLKQRSS